MLIFSTVPGVTRELRGEGYHVELDLSAQVLTLSIPEEKAWAFTFKEMKAWRGEEELKPTCRDIGSSFVSASMLAVKAKLFDDGLYAAVELAAQNGAGKFSGKAKLLARLVGQAPEIAAAASLGGLDMPQDADARRIREKFLADELAAKPIGFYTWSDALRRIFQQDRLLQQELPASHAAAVAGALKADTSSFATYEAYLDLVARLTNPLVADQPDLRHPHGRFFFPPSRAHETDLITLLYGDNPIPEGFDLADEIIRRVRERSISLQPTADSGWYDWQTWALEPLVVPERMAEGARLNLDERYRRQLEDLFKAIIALARETHIKQVEMLNRGAAMGRKVIVWVRPELTVEPLVTHYARRAAGYEFVRGVLESTFGAGALKSMARVTSSGMASASLEEELAGTIALFRGAAAVASQEIGLAAAGDEATETFRGWAKASDPDVAGDLRMMVPVFYDLGRKQTKVWAILGWSKRQLLVSFATPPQARVLDGHVKLEFLPEYYSIAYPVLAEAYVSRLLDRDEFRAHCDQYRTRTEILSHL